MGHHAPCGGGLTAAPAMADDCAAADLFPPRDVEPELVEAGRLLFAREARFVAGAADPGALPPDGMPEVAFAGRSNVGKSSLVNALTGRRMLARTSNTPGRTRQLNFFDLAGELMLVDLPGYGYAEASKAAVARWTGLVRRYLRSRAALRRVCVLVDARHGVKEPDRPVLQMLDEAGISYQVVLTKVDKLRAAELSGAAERVAAELAAHTAAHPEIHLTSAEKRRGIAALRATLAGVTPRVGALAMAMPGQPR
jgi:GTP-binding protein